MSQKRRPPVCGPCTRTPKPPSAGNGPDRTDEVKVATSDDAHGGAAHPSVAPSQQCRGIQCWQCFRAPLRRDPATKRHEMEGVIVVACFPECRSGAAVGVKQMGGRKAFGNVRVSKGCQGESWLGLSSAVMSPAGNGIVVQSCSLCHVSTYPGRSPPLVRSAQP